MTDQVNFPSSSFLKPCPSASILARSLDMQAATFFGSLPPSLAQVASAPFLASESSNESMNTVLLWVSTSCGARLGLDPSFPLGSAAGGASSGSAAGASPVALASVAVAEGCPPSPEISVLAVAGGAAGAEPPPQ